MSKCQIFSFTDDLDEVVADGLYMRAVVGEAMSIGVVNFRMRKGSDLAIKAHAHGEEVTLQLRGGCAVNLGWDPSKPERTVQLEEGVVMLMPAQQPHSGVNRFDADGWCLRLNVVTPPRNEYGTKGNAKPFYPAETK